MNDIVSHPDSDGSDQFKAAIKAAIKAVDDYFSRFDDPRMADVRAGIKHWGQGDPGAISPRKIPPIDWLAPALDLVEKSGDGALAAALRAVADHLHWISYDLYPRDQIGPAFADGHAFASLIGGGSPYKAVDFDLGIFVIAPGLYYRDHHHKAPELYAPLTGPHGWRFAPGDAVTFKPAHELVWNAPYAHHATLVGDVPFLCLYCWTKDVTEAAKVIACDDWDLIEKR